MAIKKISEFKAHTGIIDGQLLIEANGEGRSLKLVTLEISLSGNQVVSGDMSKLNRLFTAVNQGKCLYADCLGNYNTDYWRVHFTMHECNSSGNVSTLHAVFYTSATSAQIRVTSGGQARATGMSGSTSKILATILE